VVTTTEHQQQPTPIKTQNTGSRSQRELTPADRPTPAVEMEFSDGIVIALLDSQAEKTYVRPWKAEKYGKQVNKCKTTVRMADGRTRETEGKCQIEAKITTLELTFEAEVLRELVTDILIGHDFLMQQQATWDYHAATIYLGAEKRTTVSWRRQPSSIKEKPNLTELEIPNGPEEDAIQEILGKYPAVFSNTVGRTRDVEHGI